MKVSVTTVVTKRCPYKDETDEGTVTLIFDGASGDGPELHDLAQRLTAYADMPLSHEDFTRDVAELVGAHRVTSTWTTAGLSVVCEAP